MSGSKIVDWLREGLKAPGKSQSGLARFVGRHPSAINNVLNSRRLLKTSELLLASQYLERTIPAEAAGMVSVPLTGQIAAGVFREDEAEYPAFPALSLPAGSGGKDFFAWVVTDDSADRLPRHLLRGDLAICRRGNADLPEPGSVVAVARSCDGGRSWEKTLRHVERSGAKLELNLNSWRLDDRTVALDDSGVLIRIEGELRHVLTGWGPMLMNLPT